MKNVHPTNSIFPVVKLVELKILLSCLSVLPVTGCLFFLACLHWEQTARVVFLPCGSFGLFVGIVELLFGTANFLFLVFIYQFCWADLRSELRSKFFWFSASCGLFSVIRFHALWYKLKTFSGYSKGKLTTIVDRGYFWQVEMKLTQVQRSDAIKRYIAETVVPRNKPGVADSLHPKLYKYVDLWVSAGDDAVMHAIDRDAATYDASLWTLSNILRWVDELFAWVAG